MDSVHIDLVIPVVDTFSITFFVHHPQSHSLLCALRTSICIGPYRLSSGQYLKVSSIHLLTEIKKSSIHHVEGLLAIIKYCRFEVWICIYLLFLFRKVCSWIRGNKVKTSLIQSSFSAISFLERQKLKAKTPQEQLKAKTNEKTFCSFQPLFFCGTYDCQMTLSKT